MSGNVKVALFPLIMQDKERNAVPTRTRVWMSSDGRFLTKNEMGAITHTEEDFAFFCGMSDVSYCQVRHTDGSIRDYQVVVSPFECLVDITEAIDEEKEEEIPTPDPVIDETDKIVGTVDIKQDDKPVELLKETTVEPGMEPQKSILVTRADLEGENGPEVHKNAFQRSTLQSLETSDKEGRIYVIYYHEENAPPLDVFNPSMWKKSNRKNPFFLVDPPNASGMTARKGKRFKPIK